MNQTVKRIVDILFQDTVENEETNALHEELMNNCQEHYDDLISRGLTEDEAIAEVVESLKGMKDVIAEYPKKDAGTEKSIDEPEGGNWEFTGAECLLAETSNQDLYISSSSDSAVHVFCDEPKAVTCSMAGNKLIIKGNDKQRSAGDAFKKPEGEEITLSSILNMVGKAIRNVTSSFVNGLPIRIEVPDGMMTEMELNTRSGDIECSCALARKMTMRSTSGDVKLEPETEKTADRLVVSTVSGNAEISGSAMEAEVSSMSGDVTVDGVYENLRMKSTSGDAEFTGSVTDLTASSISGEVEITVENKTLKRIEAHTTSGDVEITLPSGLQGIHAECSTVSGDVLSRVSEAGIDAPVQIRAKSVSGDVHVG